MSSTIECPWCGQGFRKKGHLGRHYDYWVHSPNPRPSDQKHTKEAIDEMRVIRGQATRKPRAGTPVGMSSSEHKRAVRALQNKASYARHVEKNRERGRGKYYYLLARTMALEELEKEAALKECVSCHSDIKPDDGPDMVNFATIVYLFLPHHTSLLPGPECQASSGEGRAADSGWKAEIPSRREYEALSLLLDPDHNPKMGSVWMQTLVSEWDKWDRFDNEEKLTKTIQELGRAFVRQKRKTDVLQSYLYPTTLQEKVLKWESRIRGKRESGNIVTRDSLDALLAEDLRISFPDLFDEESGSGSDIDLDDVFSG